MTRLHVARMVRADLIYFDAGGGHRAAAQALALALRERVPWQVRLVNLQEILRPIDVVSRVSGRQMQDVYNLLLAKDWTRGIAYLLPVLHWAIRMRHAEAVRLMFCQWQQSVPDLAVSLIPHFNRVLKDALGRAAPAAPFVTVLTDIADYPPHFWIERQEQFFVCGSPRAAQQALELGIEPRRIYRTSGMILHPKFYQPPAADRRSARLSLNLDPELPTGLMMFGGSGSSAMLEIAEHLEECAEQIQLISICGRNERLVRALPARQGRLRNHVLGYTTEVQRHMQFSDFFIGKPGPGSLSEAVAMNLPVIVQRNPRTMPQERYNVDWIVENDLGIVLPNFRGISKAVKEIVRPPTLARLRANAAKMNNRALFEIPEILQQIVGNGSGAASRSPASFATRHQPPATARKR